ncbi:MAG: response regulator [Proteobacteria bacterium]|nr:response regulator [Pseudomonadota bacterium]
MEATTVLVVDDRQEARTLISGELEDAGFRVVEAADGMDGWARFASDRPDLVVTDLRMPRADGIELLHRIRSVSSVPVLLLTAYGDVPTAVSAMKAGAQEFLTFPDDLDRMIERARELVLATRSADSEQIEALLAGRSAAMERVRERVVALAPLTLPVLVEGEPGSGRDQVARALHQLGHEEFPFCAVRGGGPEQARLAGEVVYLDEVGELSIGQQAQWLDVLRAVEREAGTVRRVVASTSEDLARKVRDGEFLPEFAERLQRFSIRLAPLRERTEDLDDVVPRMLAEIGRVLGREQCRIGPAALVELKAQSWRGNLRELAGVLEKLVAFSPAGEITTDRVLEVLGEIPESVRAIRGRRDHRQREELVRLLEECGGNLAEVARRLGLSRGAVIYRAQKYGLLQKSSGV